MNSEAVARAALLRSASTAAKRVFATIVTHSPISRTEVATLTGLSAAAVTKAVRPLVAAGLVDDQLASRRHGQPGRPLSPVAVHPEALVVIGVKVNVDEVIAVATDLQTRVLHRERAALTAHDPAAVVDVVVDLEKRLRHALGTASGRVAGIGVAVSGDVDTATGIVRESARMSWSEVELADLLRARLAEPVVVENDVRALTVAEHWFGVGVGTQSFAIVTIGRGIGSGLHINGEVVEGSYGVAGEIGHLTMTSPDKICACGRRGCVEAVASTSAIEQAVSEAHGRAVSIDEAVRLAHEGDAAAVATFREAASVIGTAIANVVNLVGPELVIIGGEAVSNFDLFDEYLRAAFYEHAFGAARGARIIVRPHSFDDWARGAAACVVRSLVR